MKNVTECCHIYTFFDEKLQPLALKHLPVDIGIGPRYLVGFIRIKTTCKMTCHGLNLPTFFTFLCLAASFGFYIQVE